MFTFAKHFFLKSVCIFFSRFEGTRGDKNQIFRTLDLSTCGYDMFDFMEPN